ncbi:MAG: hypothetical protein H8E44_25525 [Planctomycetes bacterium]|nr:hypothetical protein [Planctomycetota bacterium]
MNEYNRRQMLGLSLFTFGLLLAVGVNASGADVFWAEGEEYTEQHGAIGPDRPPCGSRGACLGSSFGGAKGHHVMYRFRVGEWGFADARMQLRYARRDPGDAVWKVTLDGKVAVERLALRSTGGWGHLRDDEWALCEITLGNLAEGVHVLRLISLAERNNTNIDGFVLSSGAFQPPNTRAEIERLPRLSATRSFSVDETLTFEQFYPNVDDSCYPLEEAEERARLKYPRVVTVGDDQVSVPNADGRSTTVAVGQSNAGWDLVAIVAAGGKRLAVFERHLDRWGLVVYVDSAGVVTTIRKAIGRLDQIRQPAPTYPPNYEQTIIENAGDLLGDKVLARDGEASFEACAAFLPDLTSYTFLSTETSPEIIAVAPDGSLGSLPAHYGWKRLENVIFDPTENLPDHWPTDAKRGIAGGYLPVIDYGFFDNEAKLGWEEMAFAAGSNDSAEFDTLVYLRIANRDGTTDRKYLHAGTETKPTDAAIFFSRLLQLKQHWDAAIGEAMEVRLPERRIADACRASLVRAFITYESSAPRYGVGHYAPDRHGTFPPTTLSMVNACIEWGLLDRARQYLDYYFDHVVRPDGTFDYYGPAVSEYGQMLDVVAQYVRRSGRYEWLEARLPKIDSIIERLLVLRRRSKSELPETDVRHGLISGSPEADTRKEVDYYYSGNVWTWRGWKEIGRLLVESENDEMIRRGQQLLAECETYRTDIETSIEKSICRDTQPVFVPPVAGFDKPFERMTQDRFASYTNYRYWIEMLSAGFLRPDWHDAIIDYRKTHGGELFGTTRFSGHLDDWPYAGYAYGLLHCDRVDHYLLGFYGDLAVHRMRGTFTAYEQVAIRGLGRRTYVADYCVPAQLVTPLLTKWMLVFEERDADVLWLCRAAPRRWATSCDGIAVRRATTRWGLVDFTVAPGENGSIQAKIELPSTDFPAEIRLRVRSPLETPIQTVSINGRPHQDFDAQHEYVRIVRPTEQVQEVTVRHQSLGN